MNSLHENGYFSMVSVFRGVPLLASWPLAGLLLASGLLLAFAGLLLAFAGLLLASCWLLAGYKLPHEDFSRKSVFHKARKIGEFSS